MLHNFNGVTNAVIVINEKSKIVCNSKKNCKAPKVYI